MQRDSVKKFLQVHRTELSSLARWTQQSWEELEQIVWIAALELESERGYPLDMETPSEQSQVLRKVRRACNRYGRSGSTRSLDEAKTRADGSITASLLESIRAGEFSNPVEAMVRDQEDAERASKMERFCCESYSQFSAYFALLFKFDLTKEDAAARLAMSPATLDRRIRDALAWVSVQPSLFDRIVLSSLECLPPQRFRPLKPPKFPPLDVQTCFELPYDQQAEPGLI